MLELLAATKNNGKVKELAKLFADLPIVLRSLSDFPSAVEPEETGATFAENAVLKAREYSRQTGLWSIADDSGLEVAALGGAPGVFSARYAGENASDAEKIEKLLNEIRATGDEARRARFVCVIAIADRRGEIKFAAEGVCAGRIADFPKGTRGFGYDPIFVPDGFTETFGELPDAVKGAISHRARAANKIIAYLRAFTALST
jgi:XTP/dITP diphosphohydrolase